MLPEGPAAALETERAVMRGALVAALHGVFVLSAVIVAAAFAVAAVWLPRTGPTPPPEACDVESGERVFAAEVAVLHPADEPAAVRD